MSGIILLIRGEKVIIDADLAGFYGVPTKRLNEQVKRNKKCFPKDFMFQLTRKEVANLTSQIAISRSGHGGRRTLPYAFTEHGALMAVTIRKIVRPSFAKAFTFALRASAVARRAMADQMADEIVRALDF